MENTCTKHAGTSISAVSKCSQPSVSGRIKVSQCLLRITKLPIITIPVCHCLPVIWTIYQKFLKHLQNKCLKSIFILMWSYMIP